jgi:type VII secretion integral membrane protein EccD
MSAALSTALALFGMTPAQAAGTVVVLTITISTFAPATAFRLAQLRLPQLPTSSADLSEDVEPYPALKLMSGAVVADTYLTWLLVAVGIVCTAGMVVLARSGGWRTDGLVVVVGGVLMIRARGLGSAWQRGATLLPALCGLALLVARHGDSADPLRRVATLAGLLVATVIMIAFSRTMPGRRLLPHWGRVVDVAEYLFALGMVLLLLAVFDAYQMVRSMSG